jgi:sigma-B regulation protein RsbU (phosphoserine phosphatase)
MISSPAPQSKGGGTFVVVGDVTGHGLPAALLMASARAFLRQRISMPGPLSKIMEDVNRQLVLDVYQTGRFMTLLACHFDHPKQHHDLDPGRA